MNEEKRWEQLSPKERGDLLDKYRYVDVEYDNLWAEGVLEQVREEMTEVGFDIDQIYWSGFSSQGDGACFTGYVSDWSKFLPAVGLEKLVTPTRLSSPTLKVYHQGHYCHAYCTRFATDLEFSNPYVQENDPLRYAAWDNLYGEDGPLADQEGVFIEFLRGKMNDLYERLEAEYDYLTNDETVKQYILDCVDQEEWCPDEELSEHF